MMKLMQRWSVERWRGSIAACLVATLTLSACSPKQAEKSAVAKTGSETSRDREGDPCEELLKSLFDNFRIDKLESTFDLSNAANRMNDWSQSCGQRGANPAGVELPAEAERLLTGAQRALLSGNHYRPRDASHLRDCVVFAAIVDRITKSPLSRGRTDLERASAAFEHVTWSIQLQSRHDADLPLTPYEIYLLGRGTAVDRAWLFVNTLRAMRMDAVLLTAADAAEPGLALDSEPFLVAVPIEGQVYLFEPRLGIPVPSRRGPAGRLTPATLAEAKGDPEVMRQLGSEERPYGLTAEQLQSPAALIVGDLSYFTKGALTLQEVFAGEHAVVVADPLEDSEGVPGLWSRLKAAGEGGWQTSAVRLWTYPQEQILKSLSLDESRQDVRKGLKLRFMAYMVATPQPGMPGKFVLSGSQETTDPGLKGLDAKDRDLTGFSRTESRVTSGRQMEGRLNHLAGNLGEALKAYVEVLSNSRRILEIADDGLLVDERMLEAIQRYGVRIKWFHAKAIDDAVFWSGLCQLEQGQIGPAANTFDRYIQQAKPPRKAQPGRDAEPGSEWVRQARRLRGVTLALSGKRQEAAALLETASPDDPEYAGLQALARTWRQEEAK